MGLQRLLQLINNGEKVAAGTPNRPMQQTHENVLYLYDLIEAAALGSTIFARNVTVDSSVQVGSPVYLDAVNAKFAPALAQMDTDTGTGTIVTSATSQVWGIVHTKHNATLADILLFGYDEVDITAAVSSGEVQAGTYYLSGVEAGKLVKQRPPVTVPVLRATGDGKVFVNPSFVDFLDAHRHYRFELEMSPAGETSPPTPSSVHEITTPDSNLPGWLPADHVAFNGKNVPDGAKFGYNLVADSPLNSAWPPLPVDSYHVDLLRPSVYTEPGLLHVEYLWDVPSVSILSPVSQTVSVPGAEIGDAVIVTPDVSTDKVIYTARVSDADEVTLQATKVDSGSVDPPETNFQIMVIKDPHNWHKTQLTGGALDDLVKVNRDGIWWMSDCYDECPWPTTLDTTADVSASDSDEGGGGDVCPRPAPDVRMVFWFTKVSFATDATVVTSIRSLDDRLKIYCAGTTDESAVGDLEIDLDLTLLLGDDDETGYLVMKTLEEDGTINRGPVASGIYATSANVLLSSPHQTNLVPGDDTSPEVHHGPVAIGVLTDPTQELQATLVRLNGATDEFNPVLYIGHPNDVETGFIAMFEVPADAPSNAQFQYRARILGRAAGTLPQLTVEYKIASRPTAGLSTPIDVPETWTAMVIDTQGVLTEANTAVEATGDAIDVSPGDIVYVQVTRDPEDVLDDFAGEVGIMQQVGDLTAGS